MGLRALAASADVVRKGGKAVKGARDARLADEGSPPLLAVEHAFVDQIHDGLLDGAAADAELRRELRLAGHAVVRLLGSGKLAQIGLDLNVIRNMTVVIQHL